MHHSLVLLIEDRFSLRQVLEPVLHELNCRTITVNSVVAALMYIRHARFDVVVFDLGSDDRRGPEVLTELRRYDVETELLLVASRSAREAVTAALQMRLADLLFSPFRLEELIGMVRTTVVRRQARNEQLRRMRNRLRLAELPESLDISLTDGVEEEEPVPDEPVDACVLRLDSDRLQLHIEGRTVALSHGEVQLLKCLGRVPPGAVVTLEQLRREVLAFGAPVYEARELIKNRVHRLRQKIEQDPRKPRILLNIRGLGYYLAAEYVLTVEP